MQQMTGVPAGQPVVMALPFGCHTVGVDPALPATRTASPGALSIVHKQPLNESAKCLFCPCFAPSMFLAHSTRSAAWSSYCCCNWICNFLCWDKLAPRSYAAIYENRIEYNMATACWGCCCIQDHLHAKHFDQINNGMEVAPNCTPFHCCWCIECTGQIAASACCPACNCFLCNCCRDWYPGLSNAAAFAEAAKAAQTAFLNNTRMVSAAIMLQPMQPQMQR